MRPIITLTTDFGVSSPYVAQVKAEILCRNPDAAIVDVTHTIGTQNILEGAIVLDDVARRFPAGTLHVAVIDPGVGTDRRIVYVEAGSQRYLSPDNGLLTLVARRTAPSRSIVLTERCFWNADVSNTFHGRDIFAPVAGHLSLGVAAEELGPSIHGIVTLPIPEPQITADQVAGNILLSDSFGNLITNIRHEQLQSLGPLDQLNVTCEGRTILGVGRTYGDKSSAELIALVDSQGRLEIAIVGGNAAQAIASPGASVVVQRGTRDS
jgi:S-adenosyl-L-methionine hydrolase (adenosine-forming)